MSEEYNSGLTDDDLTLPKATVTKLIQEMLPSDLSCARDTKDLIAECCVEFIHLVSSEANEICEKESKKTITGEHVVSALKELGFDSYVDEVNEVFKDHNKTQKDRDRKLAKKDVSGMTEEELAAAQAEMFEQAKRRLQGGALNNSSTDNNETTVKPKEEEEEEEDEEEEEEEDDDE